MQTAQGSLVVVNAHTAAPQVFWNGRAVTGLVRIQMFKDEDEARVKLWASGPPLAMDAEMAAAGVVIKRVLA